MTGVLRCEARRYLLPAHDSVDGAALCGRVATVEVWERGTSGRVVKGFVCAQCFEILVDGPWLEEFRDHLQRKRAGA